jgi:hypothetical protein
VHFTLKHCPPPPPPPLGRRCVLPSAPRQCSIDIARTLNGDGPPNEQHYGTCAYAALQAVPRTLAQEVYGIVRYRIAR